MRLLPSTTRRSRLRASILALFCIALALPACNSYQRNFAAVEGYYDYRFADARESLRASARLQDDEQTILHNADLGMASLADGDQQEAEYALGRVFGLLSTAGLNRDRTTTAVFLTNEGIRIWKGEPFEQALMYHYVATLYAQKGDWENARAAAANALIEDFQRFAAS